MGRVSEIPKVGDQYVRKETSTSVEVVRILNADGENPVIIYFSPSGFRHSSPLYPLYCETFDPRASEIRKKRTYADFSDLFEKNLSRSDNGPRLFYQQNKIYSIWSLIAKGTFK